MTDLRKAAEDLLEGVEAAIKAGDWKVDGACDPDSAIVRLRQALAQEWVCCVCGDPKALGIVHSADAPCFHYTKRDCDNCESLRRAAWDRINELEAKLEERKNNVLFNDVLKSFKLYADSLGIKLKEKNT